MTTYPHLFSPLEIGAMRVRNRVVQSAHGKYFTAEGIETGRTLAYQVDRAKGGAGLLITDNRLVHPSSVAGFSRVSSYQYRQEAVDADRRICAAVHEHGARIVAQLSHYGAKGASDGSDDLRVLWGPSAIRAAAFNETPKQMEAGEIAEVVEGFAGSAALSQEAGFDGAEVHFAHGYLLHQFLSPLFNRRTDEYGGSLENRLRFPLACVAAVRERCGPGFVVGVRVSLDDYAAGGLGIEDAIFVARALRESGLVDYLNVTAGTSNMGWAVGPSDLADGWLLDQQRLLKEAVGGLPMLAVGGIVEPAHAEELVASGRADLVALIRAQIADPEWANKAREGREREIVRCIRCNQGCVGRATRGLPISCAVNPAAGRERVFGIGTLVAATRPQPFLVVGGGPAGMKAAETLAARGHRVTLVEREAELGGQLRLLARTPSRETFGRLVEDLAGALDRHGVDVRLGVEATAALVDELDPTAIVVATGARARGDGFSHALPHIPRLRGAEQANVVTHWDVIGGQAEVGTRVVVLDDDGTRAAAGVVELLLDRGCEVELVSRFATLFPLSTNPADAAFLPARLVQKGMSWRLYSWALGVEGGTITLLDLLSNREESREVDTVVLALPPVAEDALYAELAAGGRPVHRIGDCVAPRRIDHAIYEGVLAGRELWTWQERELAPGALERW